MYIGLVGISYKTAPIEVREKLAFQERHLRMALAQMDGLPQVEEKVILSTCNRVEIYTQGGEAGEAIRKVKDFLSSYHRLPLGLFEPYLYVYHHLEAIKHLFRVASSLDSMIVGEPQILGQMKEAYFCAKEVGTTGLILNQLFDKAFSLAKRVRTETKLGEHAVSVSYAAVELARKIFGSLEGKSVLVIGAGKMSELAARHLVNQGVKAVLVANRTYERALFLSRALGGKAVDFDRLGEELKEADIVISSTGAPHFILTREKMESVIQSRRNRPVFLIDIAVPRDIEPQVNEIENVYLYDIDDLHSIVQSNIKEREKEAEKAEELIEKEAWQFLGWLESLVAVPIIKSLREKAEKIMAQELEKTWPRLGEKLSDKEKEVIRTMTAAIVNKLLHGPITTLKQQAKLKDGSQYVEAVRHLFDLG